MRHSGAETALLVVDMQVGVVASAWKRDDVITNIQRGIAKARAAKVPVIWVQHHDDDLVKDSDEWQWVPELKPLGTDRLIAKQYNSAFEATELASELKRQGIRHIVLTGAATNWCIRATAYGALERGFDLTLISDAHTARQIALAPDEVVEPRDVIRDLNMTMQHLSYPHCDNRVIAMSELDFDQ